MTYFRPVPSACVWDRQIVPCVENGFHRFSRKQIDISRKKLHGIYILTIGYLYAKEERI